MHKNRAIFICALIVVLMPFTGFTPGTKKFLTILLGLIIMTIAFLIERHINVSIHWRKPSISTPRTATYAEHNGAAPQSVKVDSEAVYQNNNI